MLLRYCCSSHVLGFHFSISHFILCIWTWILFYIAILIFFVLIIVHFVFALKSCYYQLHGLIAHMIFKTCGDIICCHWLLLSTTHATSSFPNPNPLLILVVVKLWSGFKSCVVFLFFVFFLKFWFLLFCFMFCV